MSDILIAVLMGIIEGLTEFLPISSTGHLIIANAFVAFSDKEFTNTFNIVIQLGAILSVVIYFWKKLFPFQPGLSAEESKNIWERWFKAVVAFIPAAILGFLLDDFIEAKLFNPVTVSIALLVGGIILYWIESRRSTATFDSVEKMSYTTAFFVGLIQCLAMIPGTSRSAATIIGAMLLGASRPAAAEFSFFLAIPTIAAASGYKLLKAGFDFTSSQWMTLGVGFVVSFAVAYWVVSVFMKFISTNDFKPFAYYRIVLGVVLLALLGLGVLG